MKRRREGARERWREEAKRRRGEEEKIEMRSER